MSQQKECVKVVVRCRPLNSTEIADGRQVIVKVNQEKNNLTIKNQKD